MSKSTALLLIPGALIAIFASEGWVGFGILLMSVGLIAEAVSRKAMERRLAEVESLLATEHRERLAQIASLRAELRLSAETKADPERAAARAAVVVPRPSAISISTAARSAAAPAGETRHAAEPLPPPPPIAPAAPASTRAPEAPALIAPPAAAAAFGAAATPHLSHLELRAPLQDATAVAAKEAEGVAPLPATSAPSAILPVKKSEPPPRELEKPAPLPAVAALGEKASTTAPLIGPVPVAARSSEPSTLPPASRMPHVAPPADAVPRPISGNPPPPPPPRRSLLDLEQMLGVNWLSKIGVAILVIGIAFFLAWQLRQLGPFGKDVVGAIVGVAMLGAGIWAESKERYRILARATLAGGWALLYFISYATHYVKAAQIINSPVAALLLMLTVAGAMVAHTLRYRSQVVTGMAFSLAFLTVALSRAGVMSLSANVILAIGFSMIVLRMRWFPLEIIGIVATYLNHFFWLRPVIEPMHGRVHPFPELFASATILVLYWVVFRISFVLRREPDDRISVLAGVLNTALLLAVASYEAAHPELAFWAILALGVAEIVSALLVRARDRRTSFVALSVVGAALIAAAFPFRFAPGNVTLIWLLDAIVFTTAGLLTSERLYRRLGSALAAATAVQLAAFPIARLAGARLSGGSAGSEWMLGMTCLALAATLDVESFWLPRRWTALFDRPADGRAARTLGYLGAAVLLVAGWVLFPAYGASVFWAAFAVLLAFLQRRLRPLHADLTIQSGLLAAAAVGRVILVNLPRHPASAGAALHLPSRLISVSAVCALLYWLSHWNLEAEGAVQRVCRIGTRWSATLLLLLLAWYELLPLQVAIAWTLLALALATVGRFRVADLALHANAVAAIAVLRVVAIQLPASEAAIHEPMRLTWRVLTVVALSAVLYLLSRWNRSGARTGNAAYYEVPLWTASALLAALFWYELVPVAVALAWTAFAFALAGTGRRFKLPHLGLQANLLAAFAVARVLIVNLPSNEWLIRTPFHLTWRLATVATLAAFLYLLSKWNAGHALTSATGFVVMPLWSASALLGVVLWYELPATAVVLGWTALGFALAAIGHWRRNGHLTAQANAVALAAIGHVVAIDFASGRLAIGSPLQVTWRLLAVASLATLLYALSRWNHLAPGVRPAGHAVVPRTVAAALLVTLAWVELVPVAVLLVWTLIGFALLIAGRRLRLADLAVQANVVALVGIARAIVTNLPSNPLLFQHPPVPSRLLSVGAAAALLYSLSRWRATDLFAERVAASQSDHVENRRAVEQLLSAGPMWAATSLLILLAWYQLLPAGVALAWTFLAIVLLEIGSRRGSRDLTLQAHLTLLVVFARVFVVNMNIDDIGAFGARAYTVVPIVVAFLYVYRRVESSQKASASWRPAWTPDIFPWLALTLFTALLRFEVAADDVVIAWAALATAMVALGAWSSRRVFVHIGIAIALATLARGAVHNLYERSYFPSPHELDPWLLLGIASALLAGSLPFAFRVRKLETLPHDRPVARLLRWLDWRPEQILFYIPLAMVTALITTEMRRGMLTVGWGLEGVTVFLIAMWARERSYRLAGVGLLLLCIAKIFLIDFWSLNLRDKSLTGIVMGLALIGVSLLYTHKREAIRQWL